MSKKDEVTANEEETLRFLLSMEDLAEKKANIYSRLLIDTTLAKEMEGLAQRHRKRKAALETLLFGKPKKKENAQGGEGGKAE